MNRVSLAVLGTFVLILIVTGVLAYVFRQPGTEVTTTPAPAASPAPQQQDIPLIGELFGADATGLTPGSPAAWESTAARIALRFALAAFSLLSSHFVHAVGLRPSRRNLRRANADPDGGRCGRHDDGRRRQRGSSVRYFCGGFACALPHKHSRSERDNGVARLSWSGVSSRRDAGIWR